MTGEAVKPGAEAAKREEAGRAVTGRGRRV